MTYLNTPNRGLRRAAYAAAALLLAVVMTGCIKVETDLTLDDDRVHGHMIMAVDKEFLAFMEQFEEGSADDMLDDLVEGDFQNIEGATTEPWEDDLFVGTRVIFDNAPVEEFESTSDEALGIAYDAAAGTYEVTGFWDMTEFEEFDDDFSDELDDLGDEADELGFDLPPGMMDGMMSEFDITLSITFPGEVLAHNGHMSGNTVTWDLAMGEITDIHATATTGTAPTVGGNGDGGPADAGGPPDAAAPATTPTSSSATSTVVAVVVALVVVVLIAVAGVTFWLVRRGRQPAAVAAAPAGDTTPTDPQPPAPGTGAQ